MARIIASSIPLPGHFTPVRLAAADLARRGHDVTVLTDPAFESAVTAAGMTYAPLKGLPEVGSGDYLAERNQFAPGPEQLNWELRTAFVEPMAAEYAAVQEQLELIGDEPSVLLSDNYFLGGWPVALGAPGRRPSATIALGINMLTTLSAYAPPFGARLFLTGTPADQEPIAQANAGFRAVFQPLQEALERTLRDLGATAPVPFFFDALASVPDRLLQLCPSGFEYPRPDLPEPVRYVGVLQGEPAVDETLPAWWAEVEQAERVVVVTQGTLANRDTAELIRPTMAALADLDALVVVTTGNPDTRLENVPDNVRLSPFVPYDRLLPQADVLVTNGGYGGVLLALAHGVPMVVAGATEDKPEIAARVEWVGAGIDLRTGGPTPAEIGTAVRSVLATPSFSEAARRLQTEIAAHRPFDEIAGQVEELAGR